MRQGRASEPEKVRMSQRKSVRAKDEAMRARESLRERERETETESPRVSQRARENVNDSFKEPE